MFIPLHRLPPFREESRRRGEHLPVTDRLSERGVMLPTYNHLAEADQTRVVEAVAELHQRNLKTGRGYRPRVAA
jgi:perosamine synthetase